MKIGVNLVLVLLIYTISSYAQENAVFKVELSSDSILMGNYFEVKFTLENGRGQDFSPPNFSEFNLVGGPNQSSSFSMINGEVSRALSYSYFLEPKQEGNYFIEPASIAVAGEFLETPPVEVIVVPNPDGIIQNPYQEELRQFDFRSFPKKTEPQEPPKKKRKTYKM